MIKINVPASKSILNRVLLITSLLEDSISIDGVSCAADITTLTNAFKQLGFSFQKTGENTVITPPSGFNSNINSHIVDSATGFRFLLARLAAAGKGKYGLDASHQLRKRPMQPLNNALLSLGADIDSRKFPYVINARKLTGGKITIDTSLSSQFLSALLLIAPLCSSTLQLELTGSRVSWNYVSMTIDILKKFAFEMEITENLITIPAPQKLQNIHNIRIEPDYSAAATFWSLAAAGNLEICIKGNRLKSLQPDARFPEVLCRMGAHLTDTENNSSLKGYNLHGINIEMSQMPDQVPNLAALALLADSPTTISGIEHLQYKESNRILSIITEFQKLKARISYENDSLKIYPLKTPPPRLTLDTHHDHRLAMAFSILKLRFPDLRIADPAVVVKSFPDFWNQYQLLTVK